MFDNKNKFEKQINLDISGGSSKKHEGGLNNNGGKDYKDDILDNLMQGQTASKANSPSESIHNFFFIYMIVVNILGLFYTSLFSKYYFIEANLNYTSLQLIFNIFHNSFCIIVTIIVMIFIKYRHLKAQTAKLSNYIKFSINAFFTCKICIDFFNFIYLTPQTFTYSKQLFLIYFAFIALNYAFYCYCFTWQGLDLKAHPCQGSQVKIFIDNKSWNVYLVLVITCIISAINSFLFNYESKLWSDKTDVISSVIFIECSKIIIYFYLFILNYNRSVTNMKSLENFQLLVDFRNFLNFLMCNLENSKTNGVIVISGNSNSGYSNDYSNKIYFDNLFQQLRETGLGMVKNNCNNLGSNYNGNSEYLPQMKNSPSAKLSNLEPSERERENIPNYIRNINFDSTSDHSSRKEIRFKNKDERLADSLSFIKRHFRSSQNIVRYKEDFSLYKNGKVLGLTQPKRKTYSTQSIVEAIKRDSELDLIKEEKDEFEMSVICPALRSVKHHTLNNISKNNSLKNQRFSRLGSSFSSFKLESEAKNENKTKNLTSTILHLNHLNHLNPRATKVEEEVEITHSSSDSDNKSYNTDSDLSPPSSIKRIPSDILDIYGDQFINSQQNDNSISERNKANLKALTKLKYINSISPSNRNLQPIKNHSDSPNRKNGKLNSMINRYPDRLRKDLYIEIEESPKKIQSFLNSYKKTHTGASIVVNKNVNINIYNSSAKNSVNGSQSGHTHTINNHFNSSVDKKYELKIAPEKEASIGEIKNLELLSSNSAGVSLKVIYYNQVEEDKDAEITSLNRLASTGMSLNAFLNKLIGILENKESSEVSQMGPYYIYLSGENNFNNNSLKMMPKITISAKKINKLFYFLVNNEVIHQSSSFLLLPRTETPVAYLMTANSPGKSVNFDKEKESPQSKKIYNAKVSALLHDFKHIIIDRNLFFEHLVTKYQIQVDKEDKIYINTMDDYINSLILNITAFMKDSDSFFAGNICVNTQPVDILGIIDLMVVVFRRRLLWENEVAAMVEKENDDKKFMKNVNIYHRVQDRDHPAYKKLNSNKNLMMSLFYNLLSNAFKATDSGEIVIDTSIIHLNKDTTPYIFVKISDTGRGIPEHILKNWNKPFNMDPESNSSGTGLGQFIIHTITKTLNITMPPPENNANGNGATFKIYLPLGQAVQLPINFSDTISNYNPSILTNSVITKTYNPDTPMYINIKDKENLYCSNNLELFTDRKSTENNIVNLAYNSNIANVATNPSHQKHFNILLFDDDPVILNSLSYKINQKLKKVAGNNNLNKFTFKLDNCYNFKMFFDTLNQMLIHEKKMYDFIILDQNLGIGRQMNGMEVAEMVDKIYNSYSMNSTGNSAQGTTSFIFVTEQAESIRNYFTKLNGNFASPVFKSDQIFGKTEHEAIGNKIINLAMYK